MFYLLIFISTIFYSNLLFKVKNNAKEFTIAILPIAILLVLVLGLQYNVGTDYFSYYSIADGTKGYGFIEINNEILFVNLILLVRKLNEPQLIFVFSGAIQVLFLFLTCYEIKKLNFRMDYFFFLYFSLSLVFFNQFNGIRQYIAVYIIIYALLCLMNKRVVKYMFLVLMAALFHISALFFILILPFKKLLKVKFSPKTISLIIFCLYIFCIYFFEDIFNGILKYVPKYNKYLYSDYVQKLSIEGVVTKIPKLFIVLFSNILISKNIKSEKEIYLVNLSYFACFIMVISFSSTVIWRFYQYVDFFLVFPVMMLFQDKNKKTYSIIIALILIIMLLIKIVILPRGEYMYHSILSL